MYHFFLKLLLFFHIFSLIRGKRNSRLLSSPSLAPTRTSSPSFRPSRVPTLTRYPTTAPTSRKPSTSPTNLPIFTFIFNEVSLFAGTNVEGDSGDNGPATLATLSSPSSVWVDSIGNVYIADSFNCAVRKVTSATGFISTIGGAKCSANSNITSQLFQSASLSNITGIWGDTRAENLYISDSYRVFRYSFSTGIINLVAGKVFTVGDSGDNGPATSAVLNNPGGLWLDTLENIFIADTLNSRIRMVNSSNGFITTIAGTGTAGYDGDDSLAIFAILDQPQSVWGDSNGALFLADSGNNRIRQVTSDGIIRTIAGTGSPAYNGDSRSATSAHIDTPTGVTGDTNGVIYVADYGNYRIRALLSTDGGSSYRIYTILGSGTYAPSVASGTISASSADVGQLKGIFITSNYYLYLCEYPSRVRVTFPSASYFPTSLPTTAPPSASPSTARPSRIPTIRPSTRQPTIRPSTRAPSARPTFTVTSSSPASLSSEPTVFVSPTSSPSSLFPTNLPSSGSYVLSTIPSSFPSNSPSSKPPSSQPSSSNPSTTPSSSFPSAIPSSKPSVLPSSVPSVFPTPRPSSVPSVRPSLGPSQSLTVSPSFSPTENPSTNPTLSPTFIPTQFPSNIPTYQPTIFPSLNPSFSPVSPSIVPIIVPSLCPSSSPTYLPSKSPTLLPSLTPTTSPSIHPSFEPTLSPSILSSENPSKSPSFVPSYLPTFSPTIIPTLRPTVTQTFFPSVLPTNDPSNVPTVLPTPIPTLLPSRPTTAPTLVPTLGVTSPSFLPTAQPSVNPTLAPTSVISVEWPDGRFVGNLFFISRFLQTTTLTSQSVTFNNPLSAASSFIIFGGNDSSSTSSTITLDSSSSSHSFYAVLRQTEGKMYADTLSRSVVGIGDFNGDDSDDLMMGYPLVSATLVYFGSTGGFKNIHVSYGIYGESKSDYLGWAVAKAGDINGDGRADVLMSGLYKGTIYMILGRENTTDFNVGSLTSGQDGFKIIGNSGSAKSFIAVGVALAMAGDLNNDGYADIALTVLTLSSQAVIYVIYGSSALSDIYLADILTGSSKGFKIVPPSLSVTGFSLSSAGDVNGDGFGDLVIGSLPYNSVGSSYGVQRSYIMYGGNTRNSSLKLSQLTSDQGVTIVGGGFMVAGVSDVNSDGFDDVLIVNFQAWATQSNAYLLTYPGNMTSSPTLLPSFMPSNLPSSKPSSLPSHCPTSNPSASPTEAATSDYPTNKPNQLTNNSTRSPSLFATKRPSRSPTTMKLSYCPSRLITGPPSFSPTRQPSYVPTVTPSLKPSVRPSRSPSVRPSRRIIPTSEPSSYPTFPSSVSVLIQAVGENDSIVTGVSGREEIFQIQLSTGQTVQIKGGRGKKVYEIYPQSNSKIIISDFDPTNKGDVIDFSQISGITSLNTLSYSTSPLTFILLNEQYIVLSSYEIFNFTSNAFIFSSLGLTSSSSSSSSSSSTALSSLGVLLDVQIIVPALLAIFLSVGIYIISHREQKNHKGLKRVSINKSKVHNEDSQLADHPVSYHQTIEKRKVHFSLNPRSDLEEGAHYSSDSDSLMSRIEEQIYEDMDEEEENEDEEEDIKVNNSKISNVSSSLGIVSTAIDNSHCSTKSGDVVSNSASLSSDLSDVLSEEDDGVAHGDDDENHIPTKNDNNEVNDDEDEENEEGFYDLSFELDESIYRRDDWNNHGHVHHSPVFRYRPHPTNTNNTTNIERIYKMNNHIE